MMKTHLNTAHILGLSLLSSFVIVHHGAYSVFSSGVLTFFTVFILLWTSTFVWDSIIYPKFLSPLRHLPTAPTAKFFSGNGREIVALPTGIPHRKWINSVPNEGLIRYLWFANEERVFVTSPKALAEVLVTKNYEFQKPSLARRVLGRLLGVGVLLAEGEEHKTQRKNLMPAFQYRHIRDLYPVFWEKSADMVDTFIKEMKDKSEWTNVEFSEWLSRCTLDIIGVAGLGFNFNAIHDPNNRVNAIYRRVFNTPGGGQRILMYLGQFIPQYILTALPFKRNRDVQEAAAKIRAVARQVIQEKQANLASKPEQMNKDILSVALESGGFTVENLVDQTMTFLAAGHETTATATAWALLALASRPEMQTRLRSEIRANLPSFSGTLTAPMSAEQMDKLPYLHAVCNEVLRFHSPVPLTRREAIHDTTILGKPIPAGTHVVIVPWAVNFSKEQWGPDADEFRPERWLGDKRANGGGAESNFSMLTFLHGPRSCIGVGFAKAEFNCLLAAIVGRLEFKLQEGDKGGEREVLTGIVARPKGGAPLRMRVVEGW